MTTRRPALAAALALSLGALACDPVQDDAIAALGPEAPGVPRGPLHRPGQPCVVCHAEGATAVRFTIAGTVYETSSGQVASVGTTVNLTDANDASASLTTNAAGNFYATPSQYSPTFPIQTNVIAANGKGATMATLIEGNGTAEPQGGGCASCHFDPAGADSPGHVYLQ